MVEMAMLRPSSVSKRGRLTVREIDVPCSAKQYYAAVLYWVPSPIQQKGHNSDKVYTITAHKALFHGYLWYLLSHFR